MKIFTKRIENADAFSRALSGVLYFDIETTGLSADRSKVYLIGCAGHEEGGWNLTQWFDDTGRDEKEVLSSFLMYASQFQTLVHFNGNHFDLPFVAKRLEAYGLTNSLTGLASLDLYQEIAPYKMLLNMPNAKQQTVEAVFGTGREEHMSGGDLIPVYEEYVRSKQQDDLSSLLYHNEADIRGLISITPVLAFHDLQSANLTVKKAEVSSYTDFEGRAKKELLLSFESDRALPQEIRASYEGCFLQQAGAAGLLKVPVLQEEMKYFYAGYKDYYYLPAEDMAIHKSIASFVDNSHRVQANARNCYTRKEGSFLPQFVQKDAKDGAPVLFREPFFKRSYDDKGIYFELTDELKTDRTFMADYASYVFRAIVRNC
ncbi:MAG: ribonuclease H-like domain-containing protein [Lachnospiraceae bacterium]|nr:ribonuclease H-like domain-containing protein [Lachnospiraceae bacterium]